MTYNDSDSKAHISAMWVFLLKRCSVVLQQSITKFKYKFGVGRGSGGVGGYV